MGDGCRCGTGSGVCSVGPSGGLHSSSHFPFNNALNGVYGMNFFKDMFAFLANAMVGLVIAVFVAAILMEGYEFLVDSWRLYFG